MATQELQSFIEDRLRALDPTIDLDTGSPAQIQFVTPLLSKLGTDPFETDIDAFITDRFRQEFPEIYAEDPSAIRDMFVKPLIVLLDPIKREIQALKINQSLKDPTLLSDDDADALAANLFATRAEGGFATGSVRLYFSNPTNVQVELTNRAYTGTGLGFFPNLPTTISAEEMVFNREGSLYFFDIVVKAESEGDEYNLDEEEIVGITGLFGVVKATNVSPFSGGAPTKDTPTFLQETQEALTEKSLVTRRGANARIKDTFPSEVRAVQVIGAGDDEMQRDLLVATSSGHAWITGDVTLYDKIALVRALTVDGTPTSDLPAEGDQVYVYLPTASYASVPAAQRTVKLAVEEILFSPVTAVAPYEVAHLVRISGDFPDGVSPTYPLTLKGGCIRNATVSISSIPEVGDVDLEVESGEVHTYGHADVYIRPILQPTSTSVFGGVYDADPLVERTDLQTFGEAGSNKNLVDSALDFTEAGVVAGDVLIIEEGADAGVYTIAMVAPGGTDTRLALLTDLTKSATGTRFRIVQRLRVNPFEPKIPKFPFGSTSANDLVTSIGSNLFRMTSNDMLTYGVAVGDTIRVKTGSNEGDYTITGFDSSLGGQGLVVDREAGASDFGVEYEVYTALEAVELPLVRIKKLLLLDSAEQSTGVNIPYAEPVAVVPTSKFTSARVRASSNTASGCVLPDLTGYISAANLAAVSGDRRYSLGFDTPDGYYKSVEFTNGDLAELDYRSDTQGKCSWFVSTAEYVDETVNYPPIDPKPGECLTLKTGPNAGSYLIRQVVKFKYKDSGGDLIWVYFIQIYGEFPVDVIQNLITFLNDVGGGAAVSELPITTQVQFPDFFIDLLDSFGAKLHAAFGVLSLTSPGATACQTVVNSLTRVEYEWGDPARGVLRSYFLSPTLFEQWTGDRDDNTTYEYVNSSGETLFFRPDPTRYTKQEIVPPRVDADADATEYYRDLNPGAGTNPTFTDSENPTMLAAGVRIGDYLSVHEETFASGYNYDRHPAVQTTAGSAIITAPTSAGAFFTADMVGSLLFIEDGPDAGGYRISRFISTSSVALDRALTASTPSILLQGTGASWGDDGTSLKVVATGSVFTSDHVGKYLTIYGVDQEAEGTWEITSLVSGTTVRLSPTIGEAYDASGTMGTARFVVTDEPEYSLESRFSGEATELWGLRGIRIYEGVAQDFEITAVTYTPVATSGLTVGTAIFLGYKQPYRVYRENLRRVTPSELELNTDGPYYYFDTEVVSLSPASTANIEESSYLTLTADKYRSFGFRYSVDDENLTFSMEESGSIDIPLSVLPSGSSDRPDNFLNLVGSSIQVSYERASVVESVQTFLDSPQDRVMVANMLARHFIPAYVSCDASYTGGSPTTDVAKAIIEYLDNISVESPVDVSKLEEKIIQKGGNPVTPLKVMVELHDWSRKIWLEFSENQVGGTETNVPYNGTPKVAFFRPGPDVSNETTIPSGERIRLTRS